MLARLSKTLSTNAAIAGTVALVIGASGGAAAYNAGSDAPSTPGSSHAEQGGDAQDTDSDATDADKTESPDEQAEAPDTEAPDAEGTGVRPTDTHGYCVSKVAQAPVPAGSTVTHGSLVSAAAHSCGKGAAQANAQPQKHGKAFGKKHGTGRPAGVTPGAAPSR